MQIDNQTNYSDDDKGISEVLDIIDKYNLNFNLGQSIRFILRKNTPELKQLDYVRALTFLHREIKKIP
jgi:hypothetical protein